MIERLGPQRGAWNDDIAQIIEKANELVDIINKQVNERPMFKKTSVDLLKLKEEKEGNTNIKAAEVGATAKATAEKKKTKTKTQKHNTDVEKGNDDQNYNL